MSHIKNIVLELEEFASFCQSNIAAGHITYDYGAVDGTCPMARYMAFTGRAEEYEHYIRAEVDGIGASMGKYDPFIDELEFMTFDEPRTWQALVNRLRNYSLADYEGTSAS